MENKLSNKIQSLSTKIEIINSASLITLIQLDHEPESIT